MNDINTKFKHSYNSKRFDFYLRYVLFEITQDDYCIDLRKKSVRVKSGFKGC